MVVARGQLGRAAKSERREPLERTSQTRQESIQKESKRIIILESMHGHRMTKGQGAAVTSWLLLSICIGTVHAQTFQWTAVGGTLTVDPIAGFFSCSLEEDTALYPDEAACRARCRAGDALNPLMMSLATGRL